MKLLVFDKDGVLQDFHYRWAAVTHARAAALAAGCAGAVDAPAFAALLGLDAADRVLPGGLLASGSRQESTLAAATRIHQAGVAWTRARAIAYAAFDEAEAAVDFAASTRSLPGVARALRGLAAAGWKLALATTDQTADARAFLALAGVEDLFSAVVGADRVARGKPDPAMFLLACADAGVDPADAAMVGDLDVDLLMARAAGARAAYGVTCGVGDAALLGPLADALYTDVPGLAAAL